MVSIERPVEYRYATFVGICPDPSASMSALTLCRFSATSASHN